MKHIYLLTLIIASLLISCDDEDNLSVKLDNGKYYIGDNPEGKVQEYIYNFYKKYNSLILTNPDTSDYRYNFTSMNKVIIIPPVEKNIYKEELNSEENKILIDGFNFLKEVFFNQYSDEFKQKYFPTTIQLADVIKTWDQGWDTITPIAYASHNFIAISGINKDIDEISEDNKKLYIKEINFQLWYNYLLNGVGKLNIPKSFYSVSKEFYGKEQEDSDYEGDWEIAHTNGFLVGTRWGEYTVDYKDLLSYFQHIFLTDRTELETLMEKYPNIKLKYEILRNTILENFSLDITKMNK